MIRIIDTQASVSAVKPTVNSTVAMRILSRAIMGNPGDFSLILACYNSTRDRDDILSLVKELIPIDIQDIIVPPTAETLYSTMVASVGNNQPEAVMIRGLESVAAINQLIISTNIMRDEFRKRFSFPLVLWVNDEILRKLVKLAPDLKDWASVTIRFDSASVPLMASHAISA